MLSIIIPNMIPAYLVEMSQFNFSSCFHHSFIIFTSIMTINLATLYIILGSISFSACIVTFFILIKKFLNQPQPHCFFSYSDMQRWKRDFRERISYTQWDMNYKRWVFFSDDNCWLLHTDEFRVLNRFSVSLTSILIYFLNSSLHSNLQKIPIISNYVTLSWEGLKVQNIPNTTFVWKLLPLLE